MASWHTNDQGGYTLSLSNIGTGAIAGMERDGFAKQKHFPYAPAVPMRRETS